MYKLIIGTLSPNPIVVLRVQDNTFIPFDPANTDYQAFKADLDKGVDLQDAEGNVLTTEQVAAFLLGLA